MVLKLGSEVDFGQVRGLQVEWVGQCYLSNKFFILKICKNDIILVKSLQKKILWVLRQVFLKIKKNLTNKIWSSFFLSWFLDLARGLTPSNSWVTSRVSWLGLSGSTDFFYYARMSKLYIFFYKYLTNKINEF